MTTETQGALTDAECDALMHPIRHAWNVTTEDTLTLYRKFVRAGYAAGLAARDSASVPREATSTIIDAGCSADVDWDNDPGDECMRTWWRAMWDAAPKPSTIPAVDEGDSEPWTSCSHCGTAFAIAKGHACIGGKALDLSPAPVGPSPTGDDALTRAIANAAYWQQQADELRADNKPLRDCILALEDDNAALRAALAKAESRAAGLADAHDVLHDIANGAVLGGSVSTHARAFLAAYALRAKPGAGK